MLYRLVREHEELERFTHAPIYIYRFPPQYLHLVKDLTMGFNLRLALPTQGEGCTLLDTPTFAELATALPNLKKVTIWLHFSFQPPIQRCHESPQELLDGTKHWLGNGFSVGDNGTPYWRMTDVVIAHREGSDHFEWSEPRSSGRGRGRGRGVGGRRVS